MDEALKKASDDALIDECLAGTPDWYDIPDEMEDKVREQVEAKERFFWLAATHIEDNMVTRALLRRAIYAEVRCYESESRLGEMALITEGAVQEVKDLKAKVDELAKVAK